VLEIGPGTGKATVALAWRGATVVAVEPDAGMAAVARRVAAGLPVEVVLGRFEDHQVVAGSFDVVAAAQSWHWVEHTGGAAVAARALRPGGVLAAWWNRPGHLDGPVWEAIRAVQARYEPEPSEPATGRDG
jgi:SAM-dependent methyltransferase